MIVVDTSVWIDFFNGIASPEVGRLDAMLGRRQILVGDLILCELLRGFRSERDAAVVERELRAFAFAPMVGHAVALTAAENYRALRGRGVTIRKTIDLLIGTFCIENGHELLHSDRDFAAMAEHLGLRTA